MSQTGVLASAWRHKLLVAAITIAFGLGAALLTVLRPEAYQAQATVVLEDPNITSVLGIAQTESSDRLVANQLEVFRSGLVAIEAAELAAAEGFSVTAAEVFGNTTFTTLRGTDVIVIAYSDSDPVRAEVVANSIIAAYDQVQREQRRTSSASVLARLDSAEDLLLSDLAEVSRQIDELRADRAIEDQIGELLNRVASVQGDLLEESNPAAREALMDELSDLQAQMEALRLAAEIEAESGGVAGLLETRSSLLARLSSIESRRTELEIQTEIEGSGLAFFSPATATEVTAGAGLLFSAVGGLFLGGMVALGVAYSLSNWRRRYGEAGEPEAVLQAPFLAEIPRWDEEETASLLPVRDDPRSLVAEAFRFASASIDIRMGRDQLKSVNFVSATVGEGKSTLVANTALAAARAGKRVVLIDADFGNQDSSSLLFGDLLVRPGLTELAAGKVDFRSATSPVGLADGASLDVIGRGMQAVTAPDFFANPRLEELLQRLAANYDMVLIDGPPLLQVAYASTIARFADALVIVVAHHSPLGASEELARRVRLIGTHVLGYIYNQAPRRSGRDVSGGSMKDVLGDRGLVVPSAERPR